MSSDLIWCNIGNSLYPVNLTRWILIYNVFCVHNTTKTAKIIGGASVWQYKVFIPYFQRFFRPKSISRVFSLFLFFLFFICLVVAPLARLHVLSLIFSFFVWYLSKKRLTAAVLLLFILNRDNKANRISVPINSTSLIENKSDIEYFLIVVAVVGLMQWRFHPFERLPCIYSIYTILY